MTEQETPHQEGQDPHADQHERLIALMRATRGSDTPVAPVIAVAAKLAYSDAPIIHAERRREC